ncbi:uncharacterized protein BJ171DRAFT_621276 [Polychytrium aggregatum]|uniref:uncharacterized protein n=1 Tax=Polychytrium aggregatum TaxID=110093 RepID=UPI0022FF3954|nr:uncharacterized protein BJ171DRAFT_621276 [Polychytrium aggregatum]KAI9204250.1 hypothetical protein BJ171DRAFT_621276 [Polychytrium aggregatum]
MKSKLACLVALIAASAIQAQTVTGAQMCANIGLCIKDTNGNYCYDDVMSDLKIVQNAADIPTIQKYLCTECLRDIVLWVEANPRAPASTIAQFQNLTRQVDQVCGSDFLPLFPPPASDSPTPPVVMGA